MLTKEDCLMRAPRDGDVIHNTLSALKNNTAVDSRADDVVSPMIARGRPDWTPPPPTPLPVSPLYNVISGSWPTLQDEPVNLSVMPSATVNDSFQLPVPVISNGISPCDYGCQHHSLSTLSTYRDKTRPGPLPLCCLENTRTEKPSNAGCRLLWEFLAELLFDSSASDVIRWEDESSLKFKVVDAQRLADRWGREKGKPGMTYEKLSRALRYYYKTKIVAKVREQRLTYRFLQHPSCIQRGTRGAKPGVPHKRRRRQLQSAAPSTPSDAPTTNDDDDDAVFEVFDEVRPSMTSTAPSILTTPIYCQSASPAGALVSRPTTDINTEFMIERLIRPPPAPTSSSQTESTTRSSSSPSSVESSFQMASSHVDIKPSAPPLCMLVGSPYC